MAVPVSSTLSQPGYGIPQLNSLDQQTPQGFTTPGLGETGGFPIGTGLEELNLAQILGLANAAPNQVLQAPVAGVKAMAGGRSGLANIGGAAAAGLAPGDVTGEVDPLEGTTFGQRFLMNMNPAYARAFTQRQALKRRTDAAREVTNLIGESNKLAAEGDLEGAEDVLTERMKTFKYAPEAQQPVLDQIKYLRNRSSQSAFAKMLVNAAKNEVDGNPDATPLFREVAAMGREAEAKAKLRKSGQPDYSSIIAAIGTEGLQPLIQAMARSQEVQFTPEGGAALRRDIAGRIIGLGDVDRPLSIAQIQGNEYNQDAASYLKLDVENIRRNLTNPDPMIREQAMEDRLRMTTLAGRIRDVRALTHGQRQYLKDYDEYDLIFMPREQYKRLIGDIPKEVAQLQGDIIAKTTVSKEDATQNRAIEDVLPHLERSFDALTQMQEPTQRARFLQSLANKGILGVLKLPNDWAQSFRQITGAAPTREERRFIISYAEILNNLDKLFPGDNEMIARIRTQLDPTRVADLNDVADELQDLRESLLLRQRNLRQRLGGGEVAPASEETPLSRRGLTGGNRPPSNVPPETGTGGSAIPETLPRSQTKPSPRNQQSGSSSLSPTKLQPRLGRTSETRPGTRAIERQAEEQQQIEGQGRTVPSLSTRGQQVIQRGQEVVRSLPPPVQVEAPSFTFNPTLESLVQQGGEVLQNLPPALEVESGGFTLNPAVKQTIDRWRSILRHETRPGQ